MSATPFTDLVGCRLPIQLASMGGPVGTPELAAAVSEAGGLGTIPNPGSEQEAEEQVARARELTAGPIAIGFLAPFVQIEAVRGAARVADVVEFFYADPDPDLVGAGQSGGAAVGWQVGSASEAAAAEAIGCDFVTVQGIEAGGHVRGGQGLDPLLSETLAQAGVPIVAAGGIGTAPRVAGLLESGAAGVRIGTRFVAAEESNAHPEYVAALIEAGAEDTVLTEAFGVGWPEAPHRVLRSALETAEGLDDDGVATLGGGEIPRFAPQPPTRQVEGELGAMALYAGLSVDAVTGFQPAAEIVAELAADLPRAAAEA
jgi:NAD(P)H-dependent flavin oxidoreductase YrpB (nitropropane dioxygenase family)